MAMAMTRVSRKTKTPFSASKKLGGGISRKITKGFLVLRGAAGKLAC